MTRILKIYRYRYNESMDLAKQIQFIFNNEGKKTFVVLPINTFEELFEGYIDSKAIEERKNETTISLEELEQELKKDGKL